MTDTIDEPGVSDEEPGSGGNEGTAAGTGTPPDDTGTPPPALAPEALVVLAPDVLADSMGDYFRAWWTRIRGGESGALPIIVGLIGMAIFFEVQSSAFLTATNIVNLFVQATFIILLGMAELYALILSEIDLSVGFVGAVGAAIALALIGSPQNWPWWAGVIVGLAACLVIGAFQGTIITRLKIPSFVVTLAGLLGFQGILIYVFDVDKGAVGGVISISNNVIDDLVSGNMTPAAGWIVMIVVVAVFGVTAVVRTTRRRAQGLSAPPLSIELLTIGAVAAAGIVLVYICNLNRGTLTPVKGVPWVIPFVLVILAAQTFVLGRTRLGRYIYAIGASPQAARRAGINVSMVRTIAFALCSFTAGLAAIVYASRLGSISVGFDGGTYVLYAVAAAVIGGASLFGGYGKAIHPLLGGLVIATLTNGLALLNITTAGTDIATAAVLLVAVAVDATLRRRGRSGTD
jgi:D-xylose transport system permease protein